MTYNVAFSTEYWLLIELFFVWRLPAFSFQLKNHPITCALWLLLWLNVKNSSWFSVLTHLAKEPLLVSDNYMAIRSIKNYYYCSIGGPFLPRDAMQARPICRHPACVCVYVSVTFVHSVKTNKHIFELFLLILHCFVGFISRLNLIKSVSRGMDVCVISINQSIGACRWRCCSCECPPSCSVLRSPKPWREAKIKLAQIFLHRS